MVAANLSRSLEQIFGHEGGYSLDRNDPGNWTGGKVGKGRLLGTKFGIAANSYPHLDIRNLTKDQAAAIYRRDYAAKVRFDDLPAGVDYVMLDFGINAGPKRAIRFLQHVVGVTEDAKLGPATLSATLAMDAHVVIDEVQHDRLEWCWTLSTWERYGRGWTNRDMDVRVFAHKLAHEQPHTPKTAPAATLSPEPLSLLQAIRNLIRRLFG